MDAKIASLYGKHGPRKGLRYALECFNCSNLTELKRKADSGDLYPSELFLIRGNGSRQAPGLLAQYLFNLPSAAQLKQARIESYLGAGI